MTKSDLLISEVFGPTLQGEGPSLGQQALFIRLSRCNLRCQPCDTPYTWDWTRFRPSEESCRATVGELSEWALSYSVPLVVVTGGEPLIQQAVLLPLLCDLVQGGKQVEIETNGTIAPLPDLTELTSRFNVSPKLSAFGAGMSVRRRIRPEVLAKFSSTGKAIFKFVISSASDLAEISELEQDLRLAPIWVMAEGTTSDGVAAGLQRIADEVIARGWNMTPRLHVMLWGDDRGR